MLGSCGSTVVQSFTRKGDVERKLGGVEAEFWVRSLQKPRLHSNISHPPSQLELLGKVFV